LFPYDEGRILKISFCLKGTKKRNIITDILKAGGTRVTNVSFDIKIED
tara:strand:- start:349 stop:492 length:144 start_codon:yes stop_codon:yes gene_type:complete